MPFWTYMFRCADGSYYTGHTDDLERRIDEHHSGAYRGYTYERRPLELVWAEELSTREEALAAELRVKKWSRAKKEALIMRDWEKAVAFCESSEGTRRHLGFARDERIVAASLNLMPPKGKF